MSISQVQMIRKLQYVLNLHGQRILLKQSQFYSDEQDRAITKYFVQKSVQDENGGKNTTVELFSSCSQLQIMFFLRDLWYELNGQDIPTDNEKWNTAKQKYYEAHGNGQTENRKR